MEFWQCVHARAHTMIKIHDVPLLISQFWTTYGWNIHDIDQAHRYGVRQTDIHSVLTADPKDAYILFRHSKGATQKVDTLCCAKWKLKDLPDIKKNIYHWNEPTGSNGAPLKDLLSFTEGRFKFFFKHNWILFMLWNM